jgi:predicted RNase H-like HicB family nuclease
MAAAMKSYEVNYQRDEMGWWVASVPTVQGCHTQGRTIEETRRRIREALSLFVEDAERASTGAPGPNAFENRGSCALWQPARWADMHTEMGYTSEVG